MALTPWATRVIQWEVTEGSQAATRSQPQQNFPQFRLRAATRPHEAGIASKRVSAMAR